MTPIEAITKLRELQSRIICGPNTFGEVADCIDEIMRQRSETGESSKNNICEICHLTNVNTANLGDPDKPRWVCRDCCKRAITSYSPGITCEQAGIPYPDYKDLPNTEPDKSEGIKKPTLGTWGDRSSCGAGPTDD